MGRGLFLFIFILYGCSSQVVREPSSLYHSHEMSLNHSEMKLLSARTMGSDPAYFFYLESRSQFEEAVEIAPEDISFKVNHENVGYDYFREGLGKYYYRIFFRSFPQDTQVFDIYFRGDFFSQAQLSHEEKLRTRDISQSKMRVIGYQRHHYQFELVLVDSHGKSVLSQETPEILIEGEAKILDLVSLGNGKWKGTLQTVDANTIVYLSLRLNSNYLPRLLRIQHIEK